MTILRKLVEAMWLLLALTVGVLVAAQMVVWIWQRANWTPGPLIP
jgi:uncharacterized membrane protein YcjF (UPF0283 family)